GTPPRWGGSTRFGGRARPPGGPVGRSSLCRGTDALTARPAVGPYPVSVRWEVYHRETQDAWGQASLPDPKHFLQEGRKDREGPMTLRDLCGLRVRTILLLRVLCGEGYRTRSGFPLRFVVGPDLRAGRLGARVCAAVRTPCRAARRSGPTRSAFAAERTIAKPRTLGDKRPYLIPNIFYRKDA